MTESQQPSEVLEGAKSCYDRGVESEGIPVINTFFAEDSRNLELDCWKRKGGKGAFMQMKSAGHINNSYIYEDTSGQEFKSPTPAVWRQRAGALPAVRAFGSYQL
ncbi:MAG: hypothetical protein ACXWZE_01165 [Candidatus Binatia bacterium]